MGTLKKMKYLWSFSRHNLVHLNLQLLYQCNFRCKICDFWKEPYTSMPQLSADNISIISEKVAEAGPMIVSIGGGEPLLHPELQQIIRTLSDRHFPVMISNGWYVTPENARAMFKAGLYEISISVDYADAAHHDRQRGTPGAFDRALYALDTLNKNRVRPDQRVHMISVIMDDNLDDIEDLIRMARSLGVTYLVTMYSHERGKKTSRHSHRDISAHLCHLREKYPEFVAIRGYLSQFTVAATSDRGVEPCYAGKNLFNIDCQGNVTRCIDRLNHGAGNILTDDFSIIRKNLLRQYDTNDCGACWTSCRGNIESLMYGKQRLRNLYDSYQVTKSRPLAQTICQ